MNIQKIIAVTFLSMSLASCGYSGRDMEMIGQVKRVMHNTPIICSDFDDADISLGVMRGGVGSMSTQDVWVVVDKEQGKILKDAAASGALVKVTVDVKRFAFCTEDHFVTNVEVLNN